MKTLGEIDYQDLYFNKHENGTHMHQPFPGTSHGILIICIIIFPLVIMNLLVGLAVSDISTLRKTGKKNLHIAQVELIYYIETACSSRFLKFFPDRVQNFVKKEIFGQRGQNRIVKIQYSNPTDKAYPLKFKIELNEFCVEKENVKCEKEKKAKEAAQERGLKELQDQMKAIQNQMTDVNSQMTDIKSLLSEMSRGRTGWRKICQSRGAV